MNLQSRAKLVTLLLFLFALSFTYFATQSGDVLMYLALARDFLLPGVWPSHDPYLYSLPDAELHMAHEYLSYLIYYGAWAILGYAGLILFKVAVYGILFARVLRSEPRLANLSPLWIGLWILAVLAGSFRFIERASLFSDVFCVLLVIELLATPRVTRAFIIRLTLLFLLWVQLHPGFPIGLVLLAAWASFHLCFTPSFRDRKVYWLLLPIVVLTFNPLGLEGALYPFRFALNEAEVLRNHNFEWMPAYHKAFRLTPEVIAFWVLCLASLALLVRERAWFSLRSVFMVLAIFFAVKAVRFVPWSSFALLVAIKPWAHFRMGQLGERYLAAFLLLIMASVTIKNFGWGYTGSSGPRFPRLALDPNIFPMGTLPVLRANPIPGRLYNVHDFGSYLIWEKYTPVFHHGFVTDMNFYANDVIGVFRSRESFLALARKYNWTMLLVDKHGSYPYFFKILKDLPNWKIVAEDDASYLIYDMPDTQVAP